jgi:hypothetical protein
MNIDDGPMLMSPLLASSSPRWYCTVTVTPGAMVNSGDKQHRPPCCLPAKAKRGGSLQDAMRPLV